MGSVIAEFARKANAGVTVQPLKSVIVVVIGWFFKYARKLAIKGLVP
jgi:hypothetical protein